MVTRLAYAHFGLPAPRREEPSDTLPLDLGAGPGPGEGD